MAVRSEGVISTVPRKQYVYPDSYRGYGNRGLRVLLGIGGGLRITTADDPKSPTRLNQRRAAKERRVRGQVQYLLNYS